MNLILIQPAEVESCQVRLTGRRADHLRKILKVQAGDTVRVGVVGGLMGTGIIGAISRDEVVLQVTVETPPPAKLNLDLILALPRPIMLKRVLAQAAAMGVNHLFLINASRVEKSFFEASPVKDDDFSSYFENGLEQAIDTILPTVSVHPRFKPFVEDLIPSLAAGRKLIAHPDGGVTLVERVNSIPAAGATLLAIGPEGGWIDYEVIQFQEAGFQTFSLGPRILRVDTAVPAIIAQIDLALQLSHSGGRD
jgi:RsmE family RNA methyltransferase